MAIEDKSSIATKISEATRLAPYAEKSTRYLPFDGEKFCRVPLLIQSPHATLYENIVRFLLNTYVALVPRVLDIVLDLGACREIQRHRMATQTRQLLSTRYGYSVPDDLVEYMASAMLFRCACSRQQVLTTLSSGNFP